MCPSYTGEIPAVLYAGYTARYSDELRFITHESVPPPPEYGGIHSRRAQGVYLSPSREFATSVAGVALKYNIGIAAVDAASLSTDKLLIDPEVTIWAKDLQDDLIGEYGARRAFSAVQWEPNPDNGWWLSPSHRRVPVNFIYVGSVPIAEVVDFRVAL